MLDDDMKAIIKQANLSFVATVNEDGSPNLSPKSTLRPYDDNSLIFANLASPGTIENLQRDPKTEINCIDVFSRRGYRFTGTATVHSPGDALYEEFNETILQELGSSTTVHDAVLIKLSAVAPILSPAYDNPSVTEEKLRETYLRRYGVND
ncbi:MAG: pyridoxamine 5'-phosphate oxidase [Rhodospirillaceae bacterium]|nr:pyridoxamine 5'-phosphate oxidase [Rhodospirillaceae bacterium]|tara:strand:+ start:13648 stop:14100 length:453 start_codon:yes stop_codon:yes gene_type:complete